MVKVKSLKVNSSCYTGSQITSINCNNANWVNNSMNGAFESCISLESVSNINDNITDMGGAFSFCSNLTSVDSLPSSTTNVVKTITQKYFYGYTKSEGSDECPTNIYFQDLFVYEGKQGFAMYDGIVNYLQFPYYVKSYSESTSVVGNYFDETVSATYLRNESLDGVYESFAEYRGLFQFCSSLVNAPAIPNGVTDLTFAFQYCSSLVNVPTIPSGVTNMYYTFSNCSSLVNAPAIPSGVIDLNFAFQNCSSLVNAPAIPSGVINMAGTFSGCSSLVSAPVIPSAVTECSNVFEGCTLLSGDIFIYSSNITSAWGCFGSTTNTKNVYIPFKDEYDNYTMTYYSFINAGYDENGTTDGVYLKDINDVPSECTLTINPTPSDATVVLTAEGYTQEGNSITVMSNVPVTYTVSKEGYETKSNTVTIKTNTTLNIELVTIRYLETDLTKFSYDESEGKYTLKSYTGTDENLVFGTIVEG